MTPAMPAPDAGPDRGPDPDPDANSDSGSGSGSGSGSRPTLDLDQLGARVERPDEHARTAARALWQFQPGPGSRGTLEDLAVWYAGCRDTAQPLATQHVRVVVVGADSGVSAADVSVPGAPSGAAAVRSVLDGRADVALAAAACGATVRVADVGLRDEVDELPPGSRLAVVRGTGRIDRGPAMDRASAEAAFRVGMRLADEEIDAGADLLVTGAVGTATSTPAAVLVGVLTRHDAAAVTGRGAGIDDATWMRKCAAVRDALRRTRPHLGDPVGLLAAGGGADLAAVTGLLVQAAVRRTPVLLDGVVPAAAALLAHRIAFRAADWWLVAHRVPDPAHAVAIDRLGLTPVLDLQLRSGDGSGALLVLPALRTAVAVLGRIPPAAARGS